MSDILRTIAERMAEKGVSVADLAARLPDELMMVRNGYGWRLARAITATDIQGRPVNRTIQRVSFEMLDTVLMWLELGPSGASGQSLRAAIIKKIELGGWSIAALARAAHVPERSLYRLLQDDERRLKRLVGKRKLHGSSPLALSRSAKLSKKPVTLVTLNQILHTLQIEIEAIR